jgi:hypothetical protein
MACMCEESQTISGLIRSKKSHTLADMIDIHSIIEAHGGTGAVARAVSKASGTNCSATDVGYWLREGSIPAHFVRPFVSVVDAAGIVDLDRSDVLALLRSRHDRRKNHAASKKVPQGRKRAKRAAVDTAPRLDGAA